jgi:hypothetical protein
MPWSFSEGLQLLQVIVHFLLDGLGQKLSRSLAQTLLDTW